MPGQCEDSALGFVPSPRNPTSLYATMNLHAGAHLTTPIIVQHVVPIDSQEADDVSPESAKETQHETKNEQTVLQNVVLSQSYDVQGKECSTAKLVRVMLIFINSSATDPSRTATAGASISGRWESTRTDAVRTTRARSGSTVSRRSCRTSLCKPRRCCGPKTCVNRDGTF